MGMSFLALGFALQPVFCSMHSRQRPHPNPMTLDGNNPRQDGSANVK